MYSQEQQKVIDFITTTKKSTLVKAKPGCGKTYTAVGVAKEIEKKYPNDSVLSISFTKSIAEEAKTKFPANTKTSTINSLAYTNINKTYLPLKTKLNKYGKIDINKVSNSIGVDFKTAKYYVDIIEDFCKTSYNNIIDFCKEIYNTSSNIEIPKGTTFVNIKVEKLNKIWTQLIDPESTLQISHNVYLKLFQILKIDLYEKWIIIDEVQDINDCVIDIIINQIKNGTVVLAIGDPRQSMYEFNGAKYAFEQLESYDEFHLMELQETYRFGKNIAFQANYLLTKLWADSPIIPVTEPSGDIETSAYIFRTNTGIFKELLDYHANQQKVYVIGDFAKTFFPRLKSIKMLQLNSGKKPEDKAPIYDSFIKLFPTFKDLVDYAEDDVEMKTLLNLMLKIKSDFFTVLQELENITILKEPLPGHNILTTAHKAKGLEFDKVTVMSDFYPREFHNEDNDEFSGMSIRYSLTLEELSENQLGNLLYVAMTRAKKELNCSLLIEEGENDQI